MLDHLSVTFPSGRITALVGGSGSGKSTLAALLMRFYEANHGHILVGGVSIQVHNVT